MKSFKIAVDATESAAFQVNVDILRRDLQTASARAVKDGSIHVHEAKAILRLMSQIGCTLQDGFARLEAENSEVLRG